MEKGAFESTTVRWERGHPATLVVFDETGGEVERHDVEKWDIATIRETLQAKGFHHKTATMPKPIVAMAKRYQKDALRISTMSEECGHGDISYQAVTVAPSDIENAVVNLLPHVNASFCS